MPYRSMHVLYDVRYTQCAAVQTHTARTNKILISLHNGEIFCGISNEASMKTANFNKISLVMLCL